MSRLNSNIKILETLEAYLKSYPDIRFGQALVNLNVIEFENHLGHTESQALLVGLKVVKDPFYEEPDKTLERVLATWLI